MYAKVIVDSKKSMPTRNECRLNLNGESIYVDHSLMHLLFGRTQVEVSDKPFNGAVKCTVSRCYNDANTICIRGRAVYVCNTEFYRLTGIRPTNLNTIYVKLGRKSRAKKLRASEIV